MLKIVRHIRSAQPKSDKQPNVAADDAPKVHKIGAPQQPSTWQDLSRRLMQKLVAADETVHELQMPQSPSEPSQPRNRS